MNLQLLGSCCRLTGHTIPSPTGRQIQASQFKYIYVDTNPFGCLGNKSRNAIQLALHM